MALNKTKRKAFLRVALPLLALLGWLWRTRTLLQQASDATAAFTSPSSSASMPESSTTTLPFGLSQRLYSQKQEQQQQQHNPKGTVQVSLRNAVYTDNVTLPLEFQHGLERSLQQPECRGKERGIGVLLQSRGYRGRLSGPLCSRLPLDEAIQALYGKDPIVLGMDTCASFQRNLNGRPPDIRVAGLYHTGTNALVKSLARNLPQKLLQQATSRQQTTNKQRKKNEIPLYEYLNVPWSKHMPPEYRTKHRVPQDRTVDLETVLTVVLVRDPYHWMQSVCKEPYDVAWDRRATRCPSLLRKRKDGKQELNPVTINWEQTNLTNHYTSLVQVWNEWNQQYLQADFPRLMIRYEDQLRHGPRVLQLIANCAGLDENDPEYKNFGPAFTYQAPMAKNHGQSTDLLAALHKLTGPRRSLLLHEDLDYATSSLDQELMGLFHYLHAVPSLRTASKGNKLPGLFQKKMRFKGLGKQRGMQKRFRRPG